MLHGLNTEISKVEIGRGLGSSFRRQMGPFEVRHQFDLLSAGIYKLRIPDYEHVNLGSHYLSQSIFATTWFPIEAPPNLDAPWTDHDERRMGGFPRFFHMGSISHGCMSVPPQSGMNWDRVVDLFARSRLDDQRVGYLEVLAP